MSQLMKKRQQEVEQLNRMNGLNESAKPPKMNTQQMNFAGIPMTYELSPQTKKAQQLAAIASQASVSHNPTHHEKETSIQSLLQQSYVNLDCNQREKKKLSSNVNGNQMQNWSMPQSPLKMNQFEVPASVDGKMPPTLTMQQFEAMKSGEPIVLNGETLMLHPEAGNSGNAAIVDSKLPQALTTQQFEAMKSGEPIIIDGKLPPGAYYEAPVYIDPVTGNPLTHQKQPTLTASTSNNEGNLAQQSDCFCSKCKSSVEAN